MANSPTTCPSRAFNSTGSLSVCRMTSTVEVARKLEVRQLVMVPNKVLPSVIARGFLEEVTRAYGAPILRVLPEAPEMLELGSTGLFTLQFPDHPLSAEIRQVATRLA